MRQNCALTCNKFIIPSGAFAIPGAFGHPGSSGSTAQSAARMWGSVTAGGSCGAAALLSAVLFKKDAYFDVSDPLPFLGALFVHLPTLLARNVRTGNKWAKIDPCIGKMTEENGD